MLSDWVFTAAELRASPSRHDGVSREDEQLRRYLACRFITRLATKLRVGITVQRTASVYLHRFYMRRSLCCFDEHVAAAACVLLASKVDGNQHGDVMESIDVVKVEQLARVFRSLRTRETATTECLTPRILEMERAVLHALGYDLDVDHAYTHIAANVDRVAALAGSSSEDLALRRKLRQAAWTFLNDSTYTWTCVCVEPSVAAAAAVYAAGLYQHNVPDGVVTVDGAPWWNALATPLDTLKDAARYILAAYRAPFVETRVLPRVLVELVAIFHPKSDENEPEGKSPNLDCTRLHLECEPPSANMEKIRVEAEVQIHDTQDSPVGLEGEFVGRSTAWVDTCVVSVKSSPSSGEEQEMASVLDTAATSDEWSFGRSAVLDSRAASSIVFKRPEVYRLAESAAKRAKLGT